MKILYGVQATGNGHITRARAMQRALARHDLEVTWLFSGRPRDKLFDMEAFGDFLVREGMTLKIRSGRMHYVATAFGANLPRLFADIHKLDLDAYDLIITDYEPVTAWAARWHGRECIGIGHQYAFRHRVPVAGNNPAAALVMRQFAPATQPLGLHWHHFDQPILPPIVDVLDPATVTPIDDLVLVYLPFENPAVVIDLLRTLPGHRFMVYGPAFHNADIGHIKTRKPCRQGFQLDLLRAGKVICNAGFELVSEALQLGKSILVRPVQGQTEQLSNALALEQLGLGRSMHRLDRDVITDWLASPPPAKPMHYPDVATAIAAWLASDRAEPIAQISQRLWQSGVPQHKPTPAPTLRTATARG